MKNKNHKIPDLNLEARSRFQILGISLIEILVVVTIFAIVGIITARSVILSIAGSKKSESLISVRENLNYSLGIIERQIRNANSITVCPNPDTSTISYKDQNGVDSTFSCVGLGGADSYVASGSARLTNTNVYLTACSFVCSQDVSKNNPPLVSVILEGKDASASGVQNSTITTSSQIYLRNY